MDTEERLARLEKRLAELDALLERLVAAGKGHPAGRAVLKLLGLS